MYSYLKIQLSNFRSANLRNYPRTLNFIRLFLLWQVSVGIVSVLAFFVFCGFVNLSIRLFVQFVYQSHSSILKYIHYSYQIDIIRKFPSATLQVALFAASPRSQTRCGLSAAIANSVSKYDQCTLRGAVVQICSLTVSSSGESVIRCTSASSAELSRTAKKIKVLLDTIFLHSIPKNHSK